MKLVLFFAIALSVAGAVETAQAQFQQNMKATAQFHYQEPIPSGADLAAARAKIMAQVEKDCETFAKAFNRQCNITMINFQGPELRWRNLTATASMSLTAEEQKSEH